VIRVKFEVKVQWQLPTEIGRNEPFEVVIGYITGDFLKKFNVKVNLLESITKAGKEAAKTGGTKTTGRPKTVQLADGCGKWAAVRAC
jgi:hypothetical protein